MHPAHDLLAALGVPAAALRGGSLDVRSPIDGSLLAQLPESDDAAAAIGRAQQAFLRWRSVPAPRRGELVRLFGDELRAHKAELAALVTLEAGKIGSESLGDRKSVV